MDPFVAIEQATSQGKISPSLANKIRTKGRLIAGAVERVEKASGLRYPPYYIEPTLPLVTTSVEYGSVGALYARVIPANYEGKLSIIVQFTAPLLLFGLRGTVEAVAAHEFTHYVDLVRRFSRMQVASDERASTMFEAEYADEGRLVDPSLVFKSDKRLSALVRKKFASGLVDDKLNDKVAKGWIEKGLPARRVSTEENAVNVSVEVIAASSFDPMLLERLPSYENKASKVP